MASIYAGADLDGQIKLFRIVDGQPVPLTVADWVPVLDGVGAEMGEMLVVALEREASPLHHGHGRRQR